MDKKKLKFSVPENRKISAKEKLQDEEDPFGDSIIKPTEFYPDETGKTKLNWFLFELALSFEVFITRDLDKKLRKWKIGEREIADFSIHAAGEMKYPILNALCEKSGDIVFSREMVESFFPEIKGNKLTCEILEALDEALAFQLDSCIDCSNRCLLHREQFCTMFDTGPYI